MKKPYLTLIILTLLAITSLVACKKDDNTDVPPTKENLSGSYKLTAASMRDSVNAETSLYAQLLDCQKDDVYQLNIDFSAQIIDAGTECATPGNRESTWELPGNNQFVLEGETYKIVKFDGKTLKIEFVDNSFGPTYTYSSTYVKQ